MARRTVEEHAARLAELLAPALAVGAEEVPLDGALGRVLAADVTSPHDLPLFRNSQMDGYAVRAADLESAPVRLPVTGVLAAAPGTPPVLAPGTAVRIMTGAVVPQGADAVVPVEDVEADEQSVLIPSSVPEGRFVRNRGSDVRAGAVLVKAGTALGPRHLGAVAAAGVVAVPVRRRVRVAVLTTGAELVDPGATPGPGRIFDANRVALAAAVAEAGAEVVLAARSDDDPAAFAALLSGATDAADLVVTSGGISQGDFEVVRQTLEPAGGWVGEIAMQPGGPQAYGLVAGTPVVAFPGNPVSTQLSFAIFLRPLLRAAAGLPAVRPRRAVLGAALTSVAGKRQFRRGRMGDNDEVQLIAGPGSHLVVALAASDVLVVVREDVTELPAGSEVEVIPL